MFGFKKKEEPTVEENTELELSEAATEAPAEETAATEETAAELTKEEQIDQANAKVTSLQLQLGALRENSYRQEMAALAAIAAGREALNDLVKELAKDKGIDVDDGNRWNFDLSTKEFAKLD